MTMERFYFVMAVVAAFNVFAIVWTALKFRRLRCERDEAVRAAEKSVNESEQLVGKAIREIERWRALADQHQQRADRQFHLIEGSLQERDGIWKIYRDHALGAQGAQELLFSEIERMFRFIRQKAKQHGFEPWEISGSLQRVLNAYQCEHADENAAKKAVLGEKERIRDGIRCNIETAARDALLSQKRGP